MLPEIRSLAYASYELASTDRVTEYLASIQQTKKQIKIMRKSKNENVLPLHYVFQQPKLHPIWFFDL